MVGISVLEIKFVGLSKRGCKLGLYVVVDMHMVQCMHALRPSMYVSGVMR